MILLGASMYLLLGNKMNELIIDGVDMEGVRICVEMGLKLEGNKKLKEGR